MDFTDEERAEVAPEFVASLDGPRDVDAEEAWVAEIGRRARRVLADPSGGEDWSSARPKSNQSLDGREAAPSVVQLERDAGATDDSSRLQSNTNGVAVDKASRTALNRRVE